MHAQIERVYCTILQQRTAATHRNTLRIACAMHALIERVYCTVLQQRTAATHCNTLRIACSIRALIERVYCTILQQRTAATHCNTLRIACSIRALIERVYCTILQQRTAATHCSNTLQCTAEIPLQKNLSRKIARFFVSKISPATGVMFFMQNFKGFPMPQFLFKVMTHRGYSFFFKFMGAQGFFSRQTCILSLLYIYARALSPKINILQAK